jgi:ribosomal protein S18 acetylase RimI-like enzyme
MTQGRNRISESQESDDDAESNVEELQYVVRSGKKHVRFRLFFELMLNNFRTLLLLSFHYDRETDWYELKVFRGQDVIGYMHGYGNHGWNPQVNNIWVSRKFRRKGIGSLMMSRVEDYFGQTPVPGTPISDNEPARLFWSNFTSGRSERTKKIDK